MAEITTDTLRPVKRWAFSRTAEGMDIEGQIILRSDGAVLCRALRIDGERCADVYRVVANVHNFPEADRHLVAAARLSRKGYSLRT